MTDWRRCSSCKAAITYGGTYFECTVSTCNRPRTGLVFCSMDCWDAHLPIARHREAFAEEKRAPRSDADAAAPAKRESRGRRRVAPSKRRDPALPRDTLVVVSKLKAYVKAATGLNTSDAVADVLSEKIRDWCDRAAESAEADGRKTLLDRDF